MEQRYVLVTGVGITDPMRSDFDGPIMHIVRYYKPEKVYLILTKEIGEKEKIWNYNEKAVKMLGTGCEVISCYTDINNPHSYDLLMPVFSESCKKAAKENPDCKILLNTTSGTPQMQTTLAMIGIGDPDKYIPIQVTTPEGKSNHAPAFKPEADNVEDWYENNLDNLADAENRCEEPRFINFRTPIIRFQIESLVQNFDYSGALEIYNQNKEILPEKLGVLLEHGKKRMNLEFEAAQKLVQNMDEAKVLYPSRRKDIAELADYFNCMQVKKSRGELNDFILRVEVLTQYLGIYILEKCLRVKIEDVTIYRKKENSIAYYLMKNKCEKKMPGIEQYLNDNYFFENEKKVPFEWGKPINSRMIICLIAFLSQSENNRRFANPAKEMNSWAKLCKELRNPAAHTIVAITPELVKKYYDEKPIEKLCTQMEAVLRTAFGTEATAETFQVYGILNRLCSESFAE